MLGGEILTPVAPRQQVLGPIQVGEREVRREILLCVHEDVRCAGAQAGAGKKP